jgi:hypothetical protein
VGWLGWVLVGRRIPGFKGTLEWGGLVVEETEAVGVAGGERDQMFFGEVVVVVESGSDPTRGILLSDFAGSDGSFDAWFPGSKLRPNSGVDVIQEGSVAKLFDLVADVSVNGGGDGGLEVANRRGLAMDLRFEVIETGSQVG